MKIAIVHQDLEDDEVTLRRLLLERANHVDLMDVRRTNAGDLCRYDLVLNRVYASVANRNHHDNLLVLTLLEDAEAQGVRCVPGLKATRADYSKAYSARLMAEAGVPTPPFCMVAASADIDGSVGFMRQYGAPVVVKPDMGGRAANVALVATEQALTDMLADRLASAPRTGWIVQAFVTSREPFDYRVVVIDGRVVLSARRELMSLNGERPWLGSATLGSRVECAAAPPDVAAVALQASDAIGAAFNDPDIVIGPDGPSVIENNPTPTFLGFTDDNLVRTTDAIMACAAAGRTTGSSP